MQLMIVLGVTKPSDARLPNNISALFGGSMGIADSHALEG